MSVFKKILKGVGKVASSALSVITGVGGSSASKIDVSNLVEANNQVVTAVAQQSNQAIQQVQQENSKLLKYVAIGGIGLLATVLIIKR